jgi:Leucine-rich repeat (LRR) protein
MQIIPSGAFSGLGGLQRLRILGEAEAGSSDTAAPPPSLQPDTFRQLSGLASLDLTGNGLASLPRGTFCHVANLRSLNLSRNSVNQLTDIGKKKSRNLDKVFF